MTVLRVGQLPEAALAAAAEFHARVLPQINPPPKGEGDRSEAGVEGHPRYGATSQRRDMPPVPLHYPSDGPPPRAGEDLVLIFLPADHTHRAWRLAAVQSLARELAPQRVNALASDSEKALSAALTYLNSAEGVTGQLLQLDDTGAGEVLSSAA